MKSKLIIAVAILLSACTDPEEARRVLKMAGYSDVKIGEYQPWACGQDDFFHTSFAAIGPTGHPAAGVVCSGLLFKSSTIRL